jgi:hypothetical protein
MPVRPLITLTVCIFVYAAVPVQAEPVRLPNGTEIQEVSFERHVASLLSRLGCNAGACHGSFQGKGGLALSLFGYSPAQDYQALTRDGLGRRVNLSDPEQSLFLLKPSAQVAHEGGPRFAKGSWQYEVFRTWLAQGARNDPGRGAVKRLEVLPAEQRFHRPGETAALTVVVEFTDGTRTDMTPFCDFRVKDDAVAEVSPTGEVRSLRPGATAVIVSYRGNFLSARVLVPAAVAKDFVYPDIPECNAIDREVFARLRQLNLIPSDLSSDSEFLRRVTIDTIGCLPSPEEVRAFLVDPDPNKRIKKIDALLAHPLHAALWATRFCDLTGNAVESLDGPPELRPKRAKMWHDWFRARLADNVPYDQIVRGVLCATSRDGQEVERWIQQEVSLNDAAEKGFTSDYARRPSLDLFWRRLGNDDTIPLEEMAERTATAFLGVRLECAQCHKHPFDRWTQADYRAFANLFAQVQFGSSPEVTAVTARLLDERRLTPREKVGPPLPRMREIFVGEQPARQLLQPETNVPLPPRALGGPDFTFEGDVRDRFWQWLVQPDNPFFARGFVNRVWAHYCGIGLVEPVDAFSVANPPSNERLLDVLAHDFVDHHYDIRHLERLILLSRTYQLSSIPNVTNAQDRTNYSHATVRRPMAEVVVDILNSALGVSEDFGPEVPAGIHAVEIAPNRVRNATLTEVFRIFGRPPRTAVCDCERSAYPGVPQTLFLMTDPDLLSKITTGRLQKLLAETKGDAEAVEELFLATLSRLPTATERQTALDHVRDKKDRQAAFVDVVWGLINTREFILNH